MHDDGLQLHGLSIEALALYLLLGIPLAALLGFLVISRYRRAVGRLMVAAGPPVSEGPDRPVNDHASTGGRLDLRIVNAGDTGQSDRQQGPPLRLMLFPYVAAGLAFGAVATTLNFLVNGHEFLPVRTVAVVWAYAWPVVLVVVLAFGSEPRTWRVAAAVYGLIVAVLCLLSGTASGFTAASVAAPLLLWLWYGAPSLILLVLTVRSIRAIAPVLLLLVVSGLFGANLALGLLNIAPVAYAVLGLIVAVGGGAALAFYGTGFVGLLLGLVLGWILITMVGRAHRSGWLSEQSLVIDTIWLVQSFIAGVALGGWGIAALLAFVAYKVVEAMGIRMIGPRLLAPAERPLLLLRVFGFDRRSSRLMDLIAERWRYQGDIRLIAAPDLASRTIDPAKILAFMTGRLDRMFVRSERDLERRLADLVAARASDWRFGINELFCSGEIWRQAVRRLMQGAQMVVMDLRSFTRSNEGCVFELQTLLDTVPLDRLTFLVDRATEIDHLEAVLDARWQRLAATSPNAGRAEAAVIAVAVDDDPVPGVRHLLGRAQRLAPTAPREAADASLNPAAASVAAR